MAKKLCAGLPEWDPRVKNNGPSPKGAPLLTLANTGNCLMRSYSCHSDHVIEISDDSERFCTIMLVWIQLNLVYNSDMTTKFLIGRIRNLNL